MPPILSGNTLGLKFMQRGAAAKAATEARKQEEQKKQADSQGQPAAVNKPADSSDEEGSSSDESVSDTSDEERSQPVASTSKLPSRHQPSITTESSYLAFPILSTAYGVASVASETAENRVNGRFSFGKPSQSKGKKQKEPTSDSGGSDSEDEQRASSEQQNKKKKDKMPKIRSISAGGSSGYQSKSATPTIREQKRARTKIGAEQDTSEGSAQADTMLEEDKDFVDDMMEQARRKRQLDNGQTARKKKRKSEDTA